MLKPSETTAIKRYLDKIKGATKSYPYQKTLAVYSVNGTPFAFLETDKQPLRLSLRSDPELSKLLRAKYEEVTPGHKLDQRYWNTIILSGQLSPDEVLALIDHSYQLALKEVYT
jgi:predicted DNA-binding protein (MmcQ/YjbR family)